MPLLAFSLFSLGVHNLTSKTTGYNDFIGTSVGLFRQVENYSRYDEKGRSMLLLRGLFIIKVVVIVVKFYKTCYWRVFFCNMLVTVIASWNANEIILSVYLPAWWRGSSFPARRLIDFPPHSAATALPPTSRFPWQRGTHWWRTDTDGQLWGTHPGPENKFVKSYVHVKGINEIHEN